MTDTDELPAWAPLALEILDHGTDNVDHLAQMAQRLVDEHGPLAPVWAMRAWITTCCATTDGRVLVLHGARNLLTTALNGDQSEMWRAAEWAGRWVPLVAARDPRESALLDEVESADHRYEVFVTVLGICSTARRATSTW